jgi:hypothetical protein
MFGGLLMMHSSSDLTLFPVRKTEGGPLEYICDQESTIKLPGAHGEEIVRDIFTDVNVSCISQKVI